MTDDRLERITCIMLALWCLLPAGMTVACACFGAADPFVAQGLYVPQGTVYGAVGSLYRRTFLVLGAFTMLLAALLVFANRGRVFSKEAVRQQPWFYLLAALLAWAVVSTALSDNPFAQLRGTSFRCDGLFSYFIYAAVLVCALSVRSEARKQRLLALFVFVVDALSVCLLLEVLQVEPVWLVFQSKRAVVFNNLNHFGYVLCMSSLVAAGMCLYVGSRKLRVACVLSFAFQVFALLVNDTFGCYLAVFAGLVAMVVFWAMSGRKLGPAVFVPLIVFAALSAFNLAGGMDAISTGGIRRNFLQLFTDFDALTTDSPDAGKAGSGRMRLWLGALGMIPERPLFGFGPEGLTGDYYAAFHNDRPHNEFIQYAVFLGVPGLLFYLAALVALAHRQWKRRRTLVATALVACGVVVGYVASSFFGNTMFNTAPYFWMMLGFAACAPPGETPLLASEGALPLLPAGWPRAAKLAAGGAALVLTFLVIGLAFTL